MKILAKIFKQTDVLLGFGLLLIVGMLVLPLPHWLLDLGLVISLATAVMMLLSAVNVDDPLKFSVFPSMLLVVTLFRLSLSICATKLILGTGKAGAVIETFGNFVMGGNFVVGFVIFLILMVVQFIVITNGAGRVAEVTARFTLDAMPGKQMAIDADLAAGLIDENQARERRKNIKLEADFYGAMDGASKFVKGDAVAAILIIVINILGGFAIGFFKGQGDMMTILKTYSLLSVGEGLIAQIPALLISTASGLLVTRTGQEQGMGGALLQQMVGQPKALAAAGVGIVLAAFVPGFPKITLIAVGGGLLFAYQFLRKNPGFSKTLGPKGDTGNVKAQALPGAEPTEGNPASPDAIYPLLAVDPLEIEIGYALTKVADVKVGGDLPERVTATRRQIAVELGFVMPSVRIRDSIALQPNEYIIKVRGEEVARAFAEPNLILAISSGTGVPIAGIPTREPVFGLDALWIEPQLREQAERGGYTTIEPGAMLATHLSEVVKAHAAELLTRQDVHQLIEHAREINPTVVEELVPLVCPIGDVQKVLQHLLRERVPIRDMVTILETMADFAGRLKDTEQLGELVRAAIARTITRQYVDEQNKLYCITLEPSLERTLIESIQPTSVGNILALDPVVQQQVISSLQNQVDSAMTKGMSAVLLCSNQLRLPLRRLVERYIANLNVLAFNEVSSRADVEFVGQVAAA